MILRCQREAAMKPWVLLDTGAIPGGGELQLYQHDRDFFIKIGPHELMRSRDRGSEDDLALLARERLGERASLRVLVGGLGMGFTLAAALRGLGPDGLITVAELVPKVVEWNHGPLAHLAGTPLADPRVAVHTGDVARILRTQVGAYDLILMDVDNGPAAMTTEGNDWLYGRAGLASAHRALRAGGILAVWSSVPDPAFTTRLRQAGFVVDCVAGRARGKRGPRHVIWFARRSTTAS
jgi:spermidine synthase